MGLAVNSAGKMAVETAADGKGLRLRRAEPGDASAISALAFRSKASNGYDQTFMHACRAELSYTPETMRLGETWLAEGSDGRLLGFFDLRPRDGEGDVYAMFVEPACKRSGVGRALWRMLEECAAAQGMMAITLDSDPFAVSFYEAMGLRVVGEAPSGSIPGRMLPHMRKPMPAVIRAIEGLDLRLSPFEWPFAAERRKEIERHWRELERTRNHIWNGSVVLTRNARLEGGRLAGTCFPTDYAAFTAWRDWGWPDRTVTDCFGSALVLSCDGALLYGRMAASTLNAGRIYPPGGMLDADDVRPDGAVSIVGSIARELAEETGLAAAEAVAGRLWTVWDGRWISVAQELRFPCTAVQLLERIGRFLSSQHRPELAGVVALRRGAPIPEPMPSYAQAIARHILG
jgi:GNAT superfamily N-acetyltransferase